MKQENDKLHNLLQDVFNDYEVTPDPDDWNRIAQSLNKAKSRRLFLWTVWSAVATILLLLAIYTGDEYFKSRPALAINHIKNTFAKKQNQPTSAYNKTTQSTLANLQPVEKKKLTNSIHEQIATNKIKAEKINSKNIHISSAFSDKKEADKVSDQSNNSTKTEPTEVIVNKPDINNTISTNQILASKKEKEVVGGIKTKAQLAQEQLNALKENHEKKQIRSNRVFILSGLALGNSSGFQPSSSSDKLMTGNAFASSLASNMFLYANQIFDLPSATAPNIGGLYQNIERNFKPPLTLALTATFSLGKKFSLESGFQYTKLQSNGQITIQSANNFQSIMYSTYNVNEVLHYVGIPVMLNYTLVGNKRFKTFISSGFTIEKGIQAYYKAVSRDNIPGAVQFSSHNSIKGLQESFSGGLGLSYLFIPHFELYVQPSLTYYFKPAEGNTTIYSVDPWLLNLRSGIRYTFK